MRFLFLFMLSLCSYFGLAYSQHTVALIPQPVEMKTNADGGTFLLNRQTIIYVSDSTLSRSASFLANYLQQYYQLSLNTTNIIAANGKQMISLNLDTRTIINPNRYLLKSDHKTIVISGGSPQAVFYGIQSLIQLLPVKSAQIELSVPPVIINDYPRFGYRGMHLDVSRHYFDINFIKRYIDYLALHKLNYFHWHLTDDHGWRIEIKKYPKLTDIGAWRNGTIIGLYPGTGNDRLRYGGFYTQDEVKEVVRYAADRYITVIPEIEMPGHSMAVLASYPELGTNPSIPTQVAQTWGIFNKFNNVLQPTEKTFGFLEDVLTEVIQLFPSPYIHIGGDECSKIWWKQSALSQRIIREKGLKDENGLQSYFIHRMEKFVNAKGRTIIGWDEILDGGLAPNAIVMSWRGEQGGIAAAKQKHKVIMTPENYMYFNHAQFLKEDSLTASRYVPLKNVYNYEPVPAVLTAAEAGYIWGAQGNLWSEYVASPAKAEYQLFPRLDALSEVLWSPKIQKDFNNFQIRLKTQLKRYDLMKINYSKKYLDF